MHGLKKLRHDCQEPVSRFKMYKSGTQWLVAGVTTVLMATGVMTFGHVTQVQASTTNSTTTVASGAASDATNSSAVSAASSATSSAAPASSTAANTVASNATSSAVANIAASAATSSAAISSATLTSSIASSTPASSTASAATSSAASSAAPTSAATTDKAAQRYLGARSATAAAASSAASTLRASAVTSAASDVSTTGTIGTAAYNALKNVSEPTLVGTTNSNKAQTPAIVTKDGAIAYLMGVSDNTATRATTISDMTQLIASSSSLVTTGMQDQYSVYATNTRVVDGVRSLTSQSVVTVTVYPQNFSYIKGSEMAALQVHAYALGNDNKIYVAQPSSQDYSTLTVLDGKTGNWINNSIQTLSIADGTFKTKQILTQTLATSDFDADKVSTALDQSIDPANITGYVINLYSDAWTNNTRNSNRPWTNYVVNVLPFTHIALAPAITARDDTAHTLKGTGTAVGDTITVLSKDGAGYVQTTVGTDGTWSVNTTSLGAKYLYAIESNQLGDTPGVVGAPQYRDTTETVHYVNALTGAVVHDPTTVTMHVAQNTLAKTTDATKLQTALNNLATTKSATTLTALLTMTTDPWYDLNDSADTNFDAIASADLPTVTGLTAQSTGVAATPMQMDGNNGSNVDVTAYYYPTTLTVNPGVPADNLSTGVITPKNANTPVSSTDPNSPKYPSGVSTSDLQETVTETVNYKDAQGNTVHASQANPSQLTFYQTATLNFSTGTPVVTYNHDWQPVAGTSFDAMANPVVPGYVTTAATAPAVTADGSQTSVTTDVTYTPVGHYTFSGTPTAVMSIAYSNNTTDPTTVDPSLTVIPNVAGYMPSYQGTALTPIDAADVTKGYLAVTPTDAAADTAIVYIANAATAQVKYVDDDAQGTVVGTDTVNGNVDGTITYDLDTGLKAYTAKGYVFVSDDLKAGTVYDAVADTTDNASQIFTVHLKHGTTTYTPANPGTATGATATDLHHAVTVTNIYDDPINQTVTEPELDFYRTATVDNVTNTVTSYGHWTTQSTGVATMTTDATITISGDASDTADVAYDNQLTDGWESSALITVDGATAFEGQGMATPITVAATNTAVVRHISYIDTKMHIQFVDIDNNNALIATIDMEAGSFATRPGDFTKKVLDPLHRNTDVYPYVIVSDPTALAAENGMVIGKGNNVTEAFDGEAGQTYVIEVEHWHSTKTVTTYRECYGAGTDRKIAHKPRHGGIYG